MSSVSCIFCRKCFSTKDGHDQYEDHLRDVHCVWSNRAWLVDQTLQKQNAENSRTVIKVNSDDDEGDMKSAVQVLAVNVEDSLSNSSGLRRSSRKRLSNSGWDYSRGNKTAKKGWGQAVDIQEPLDMVTQIHVTARKKFASHGVTDSKCFAVSDLTVEKVQVCRNSEVNKGFGNEDSIQSEECENVLAVPSSVSEDITQGEGNENVSSKEIKSEKLVLIALSVNEVSSSDGKNEDVQDVNNNESINRKEKEEDDSSVLNEFIQIDSDSEAIDVNEPVDSVLSTGASDKEKKSCKVFSDDFSDSCVVECGICDKHMSAHRLRSHTATQHNLPISQYKEQFGNQPVLIKTTYHICKLCGKEILLDLDSVASHVRTSHKVSIKEYNSRYMILRRKAADYVDEKVVVDNPASTAANVQTIYDKENDNVQHLWFDANTFTCNICQFSSNSLKVFKKHVKREHATSLAKFSSSYSSTDVLYKCHCCEKQVYHEMSAIKTHVEGHLLSMEQYAGLYERKRSRVLRSDTQEEEKMVSVTVQELDVSHNDKGSIQEQDPLDITSTLEEQNENIENPHHNHEEYNILPRPGSLLSSSQDLVSIFSAQKYTSFDPASAVIVSGIISTIIQSVVAADMDDQEDNNIQNISCSASSTTNNSTLSDVFLYMCPFPDCDFHMDTRGLESGQAERHAMSVHHLAEVGDHAWRKVSLEARMEQLFSDD